ncbi:MAG TPA: ATP-binding protein, partial [Opitutaceae bacterium]|nr:ATP-binding protein [Opitutaceae bacterium]
ARQPSNGYVTKHRRKDGSVISVEISSRVIMFDGREAKLALANDITERKKLEAQFLRAQRIEGIGTLATGMAHDLNNILAPILISAGTLRWGLSADEQEKAINRIEVSVKRGAGIIQQVLTFGRGLNGERAPINAAELIDEVTRIVTRTFPKDIVVSIRVDEGLWTATGDRTQIHQVLLNLCVNARDAMPAGGKLSLEAENCVLTEAEARIDPLAQPGPYVRITVTDTGHGIPADIINRIFDPFFTTKGVGKGTGLGLSTVMGIVKNHGGFVRVYSEPGKGASFRVCLPAEAGAGAADVPAAPAKSARGRGELILLVDDEAGIREVARHTLENHGYRVATAANGEEAVSRYLEHRDQIRLVMTDMMMPVMDGPGLIRTLRVLDRNLKVIPMSGLEDVDREAELAGLGAAEILPKPFETRQLLERVRKCLGGR